MQKARQVNNEVYRSSGHMWWDEDSSAASLRYMVNPVRFGYFRRICESERDSGRRLESVLDVGCGGGLLAEEFAKEGFTVSGVDPARESLECAKGHASAGGLTIDYQEGGGRACRFRTPRSTSLHVAMSLNTWTTWCAFSRRSAECYDQGASSSTTRSTERSSAN